MYMYTPEMQYWTVLWSTTANAKCKYILQSRHPYMYSISLHSGSTIVQHKERGKNSFMCFSEVHGTSVYFKEIEFATLRITHVTSVYLKEIEFATSRITILVHSETSNRIDSNLNLLFHICILVKTVTWARGMSCYCTYCVS